MDTKKKKSLFKSRPILLIGIGILILGFIYDVMYINIPPQDPPAYLIKERQELYKTLTIIYNSGYFILVTSLLKGLMTFINKKRAVTKK